MSRVEHIAEGVTLYQGDCREILPTLGRFDAVVTDPPYELGFMGKSWDASGVAFCPDTWRKVLRVMKPGAHLVAFGAPKNYHRLACAIEDAGFEIRDSLMWVFGSGFPKSHAIDKHIDRMMGAIRPRDKEVSAGKGTNTWKVENGGQQTHWVANAKNRGEKKVFVSNDIPITDEAKEWEGWGTALKPAYEPIVLARKPLSEGTVAANVLRWGTGALNIDATRVGNEQTITHAKKGMYGTGSVDKMRDLGFRPYKVNNSNQSAKLNPPGRWPANLCHDGSQGVLDLFPQTKSGNVKPYAKKTRQLNCYGKQPETSTFERDGDEGSAARFFYCAKASKQDRAGSKHPTVKPINLMRWLVRMVTPPGGIVLDPFGGSGTTAQAAVSEGFKVTLIERESEYCTDIQNRMRAVG